MGKRFVMGDIHGNYKGLKQVLERSNFNIEEDTLVQLGDIVDRGPNVNKCVETLSKIQNFIGIRGNHDERFDQWLKTGIHPTNWRQGGKQTALSYLKPIGREDMIVKSNGRGYLTSLNPGDIPEHHMKIFYQQLDYYIDDDNNLFVHGGFNRHFPFKNQDRNIYLWDRDLWLSAMSFKAMENGSYRFRIETDFKHIYIGHTSTTAWKGYEEVTKNGISIKMWGHITTPITVANITNMDTGSGNVKGKLTIMNIDTKEIFQSDLVGDLYPNY